MSSDPFVYFIRPVGMEGPVKIGYSAKPQKRLMELSVWSPFPLEIAAIVPGNSFLEHALHQKFSAQHSHREWFSPSEELTNLIAALSSGMSIQEAIDLSDADHRKPARQRGPRPPKMRIYLRWRIGAAGAKDRSTNGWRAGKWIGHQERHYPNDLADAEIELLRKWAKDEIELPENFHPVEVEKFISDPIKHGVPHSIKYGEPDRLADPLMHCEEAA